MISFTMLQTVKTLAGRGCAGQTGELAAQANYRKAFLVYDPGVKDAGIVAKITSSLAESGIGYTEFDQVLPNPPARVVEEGLAQFRSSGCDCIIAVGGGSAIDTAKGINILRFNGGAILDYVTKNAAVPCSGLIAIPTTSGTGSEYSQGAIITDEERGLKAVIISERAACEYAILDPELTAGMPEGLTVMTGLDVFSHAAEAYTTAAANQATDMICEKIMQTVVESLPEAVKNGRDIQARARMQTAAALAGWMLTSSGAHMGHSIAHTIGAQCHIVHGAACAYGLPAVLSWLSPALPDKVRTIGRILGAQYTGTESAGQAGKKAAEAYCRFRDITLGLKPVTEYESAAADIDGMAQIIMNDPSAHLSVIEPTHDQVVEMLREALCRT